MVSGKDNNAPGLFYVSASFDNVPGTERGEARVAWGWNTSCPLAAEVTAMDTCLERLRAFLIPLLKIFKEASLLIQKQKAGCVSLFFCWIAKF